jgi:ribokinase
MNQIDFLAVGDCTVDEFIKLKDAEVHCDVDNANCTISMSWGDKIPYESAVRVPGVGNAANAAVAAARLGLTTGFMSNIGNDAYGKEILETYAREGIDPFYIAVHDTIPTNHHYVLQYGPERTILIRHEAYPYALPEPFAAPRWIYLSSAGESSAQFHLDLAAWLRAHPETKLAFQPGTFQMEMGKERLAPLYEASELVACNKQEAERILGLKDTPIIELLEKMHALGPKIVLITDGPNGSYVSDGTKKFKVSMYPDLKPPVDRTGAGDACTSTFVVALALGKSIEEALMWGPINSMSVVQYIGAQEGLLSREKLEEHLKNAPTDYKPQAIF